MKPLIVVDAPEDWPPGDADPPVISARSYLTDPAYGEAGAWRVVNLCQCRHYQNPGYYVSLLAAARDHHPLPAVDTVLTLQSRDMTRLAFAGLDLEPLVAQTLAREEAPRFKLRICFGEGSTGNYDILSRRIFECLPAPLLGARFARRDGVWQLRSLRPLALRHVPAPQRHRLAEAARAHFARPTPPRFRLAILNDKDNRHPASNARAIERFRQAAAECGIHAEIIGRNDADRLAEFDGLFIRDNTFIRHYTYRFSRLAAARGLVVIDDPMSVLRCNNKVYVTELLARHRIPTPRTLVVGRESLHRALPALGLPCVLKQPDSCLSLGVTKAETEEEFHTQAADLLCHSDLIVVQQYLPTDFDWRIGVLDGRPLFACRYYMVPGHWQIVRHEDGQGHYEEGRTEALPLTRAPPALLRLALKAAALIGDGFYGVDIKQVGRRYYVMEINDNPNVDAGNEDAVLGDALYREVMAVFARRLAARKGSLP